MFQSYCLTILLEIRIAEWKELQPLLLLQLLATAQSAKEGSYPSNFFAYECGIPVAIPIWQPPTELAKPLAIQVPEILRVERILCLWK